MASAEEGGEGEDECEWDGDGTVPFGYGGC